MCVMLFACAWSEASSLQSGQMINGVILASTGITLRLPKNKPNRKLNLYVTPKHPMGQRVFVSFDVSPVGVNPSVNWGQRPGVK